MGKFSTISVEEIITRASLQLRLQDSSESDFLSILAFEAISSIGALSCYVKQQCEIDVCDGRAKLPKNFQKFIAIRVKGTADTGAEVCQMQFYADRKFLSDCGCSNTNNSVNTSVFDFNQSFQIVNGYIIFHNSPNVDSVTLAYLGLNLDTEGNHIIYEEYERAVSNYICWQFATSLKNEYPESRIRSWQKNWVMQKQYVKGIYAKEDFVETKREVSLAFNALLISKIVNYTG